MDSKSGIGRRQPPAYTDVLASTDWTRMILSLPPTSSSSLSPPPPPPFPRGAPPPFSTSEKGQIGSTSSGNGIRNGKGNGNGNGNGEQGFEAGSETTNANNPRRASLLRRVMRNRSNSLEPTLLSLPSSSSSPSSTSPSSFPAVSPSTAAAAYASPSSVKVLIEPPEINPRTQLPFIFQIRGRLISPVVDLANLRDHLKILACFWTLEQSVKSTETHVDFDSIDSYHHSNPSSASPPPLSTTSSPRPCEKSNFLIQAPTLLSDGGTSRGPSSSAGSHIHIPSIFQNIPQHDISDPHVRWTVFCARAERKFTDWVHGPLKHRYDEDAKWLDTVMGPLRKEEVPEIEVLLVWFVYMLSPRCEFWGMALNRAREREGGDKTLRATD